MSQSTRRQIPLWGQFLIAYFLTGWGNMLGYILLWQNGLYTVAQWKIDALRPMFDAVYAIGLNENVGGPLVVFIYLLLETAFWLLLVRGVVRLSRRKKQEAVVKLHES